MDEKKNKYINELKRLEGMFGMTFTQKERDKIVEIKLRKEKEKEKNYSRR